MGLEVATYIHELNPANPLFNDFIREADDHMRLIKQTLQNTFPNITGAVNATEAELNLLVGATTLGTPGGVDTQVQFNSSGNFAGSSNLVFDGTTLTGAAMTITGLTTLGFVDTSANGIVRAGDAGSAFISGGTSQVNGARATFFGGTHAGTPGNFTLGVDNDADFMEWDNTAGSLQINTGAGASKTATATFLPTQVTIGNFVFDADQSVGPTEDGYLLEYDDASGEIRLAVPPAGTGNVTISGTPAADQIAVWATATAIEGDAQLTWDGLSAILTANDGGGNQFQWQGDQLLLSNTSNIFFEALQGEWTFRDGSIADPTAGGSLDLVLRFESQDANAFGELGYLDGGADVLELRNLAYGADAKIQVTDGTTMTSDFGLTVNSESWQVNLNVNNSSDTIYDLDSSGAADLTEANFNHYTPVNFEYDLIMVERADHAVTIVPGVGHLWVRNDSPNVLVFTNDDGTDIDLGAGVNPGTVTDATLRWSGSGWVEETDFQINVSGNIVQFGVQDDCTISNNIADTCLISFPPPAVNGTLRMAVGASNGHTITSGNNFTITDSQNGDTIFDYAKNGGIDLYNNDVNVARTATLGSGGFEVNNTVTGGGFERVLTTSDATTSPGGADTEVQYNNGGALGGMGTAMTFNDSTFQVSMAATLAASNTALRISPAMTTGFAVNIIDDAETLTAGTMLSVSTESAAVTGNLVDLALINAGGAGVTLAVSNAGAAATAINVTAGFVDVGNIRLNDGLTQIETTSDDLNITADTGAINFGAYLASYPGTPQDRDVLQYVAANSRFEAVAPSSPFTVVVETTTTRNAVAFEAIMVDDDTAGAPVTINLPAGSTDAQVIVNKRGTTANVTVDGDLAETINGAATFVLTAQYASVTLIWTGTEWAII